MSEEENPNVIEMTEMINQVDEFVTPLIGYINEMYDEEGGFISHFIATYTILRIANEFDDIISLGIIEKSKQLFIEMRNAGQESKRSSFNPLAI